MRALALLALLPLPALAQDVDCEDPRTQEAMDVCAERSCNVADGQGG